MLTLIENLDTIIASITGLVVAIDVFWTRHVKRGVDHLRNGEIKERLLEALDERDNGKTHG